MAYTKTTWVNNQAPAINADNLNKIEDGIYNSVRYADAQTLTDAQKTQARANIAAAPDGFGLGKSNVTLTASDNLDNVTGNGWYSWGSSTPANAPTLIHTTAMPAYCAMFMIGSSQIVVSINQRNNTAMRSKNNEGWSPWEYINPPLALGVEYRTTERYLGKPVYKKLVRVASVPAGNTTVQISEEPAAYQSIVSADTYSTIPAQYNSQNVVYISEARCTASGVTVTLTNSQNQTFANYDVLVAYTKS